jgi:hypothetical protein
MFRHQRILIQYRRRSCDHGVLALSLHHEQGQVLTAFPSTEFDLRLPCACTSHFAKPREIQYIKGV